MDITIYALEVITKSRLAELRAGAARHVLLESIRVPRRSIRAVLRSALQWTGHLRGRRGIVRPRHA